MSQIENNNIMNTEYESFNFNIDESYDYSPKYKAVTNKDWVPYGRDNDYPERLLELYNDSVLHHALIEGKAQQILGDGYRIDDVIDSDIILDSLGNEGLNDIIENIAKDLEIYNGFSFLIHYSRNWKNIIDIEYIDYSKLRCSKLNDDNEITHYYYKNDWKQNRTQPICIKAWNKSIPSYNANIVSKSLAINDIDNEIFIEDNTLIYVYNKKTPGLTYYTHPEYVAAINVIITDKEVDKYGINSMINSLSATASVTFKGIVDEKSKKDEAAKFIKMYTGTKSRGLPMILFSGNDDSKGVEVNPINLTGNDDRYTKINENTLQKILIAHRVTSPLLVGIKTPGQLGNTEEIKTSYIMFYKQVIKPKQNIICNSLNKVLSYDIKFKPITLSQNKPYDDEIVQPKEEQTQSIEK